MSFKLDKKQLALIYMCIFNEIDTYTPKDVETEKRDFKTRYDDLVELQLAVQKEIKK